MKFLLFFNSLLFSEEPLIKKLMIIYVWVKDQLKINLICNYYIQIPPEAQAQLKEQILLSVQNEQTENIRRKVCDVAAEVARNLIDEDGNNQWPEFLQFLFQCANSPLPALKESALRMFTWVSLNSILWICLLRKEVKEIKYACRSVPGVFGNQQANHLDLIKQMLQQSVLDMTNYEVIWNLLTFFNLMGDGYMRVDKTRLLVT